jgi:hypothetical protein
MALGKVIEEFGGAGLITHFLNIIRKELSSKNIANMSKTMPNKNYVTGTSKYPKSPELVLRILNAYQPPPG